jgi:hypothetical protein
MSGTGGGCSNAETERFQRSSFPAWLIIGASLRTNTLRVGARLGHPEPNIQRSTDHYDDSERRRPAPAKFAYLAQPDCADAGLRDKCGATVIVGTFSSR